MRFLILSDIHGNRFGLEAVLHDARGGYDQLLCLGDVVGYGAHPNECCALLREHQAWCLSGNHDAAALGLLDITWFNPVARAAILWTRAHLTVENRQWLRQLPAQSELAQHKFQAVHGSLWEPWEEYITGPDVAETTFTMMSYPLCFFGHTHVAVCFRRPLEGHEADIEWAPMPEGGQFDLEAGWKYLVNPGSCGQPRDSNPQARYALYDTATQVVQIIALDYDWDAARAAILEAGLPKFLGDRLLLGR